MKVSGVQFFPITPFDDDGINEVALDQHIELGMNAGAGGVFAACAAGEGYALSADEFTLVASRVVGVAENKAPVFVGVGGALGQAKTMAETAHRVGCSGTLLLPPYLVTGTSEGLVQYVREVAASAPLPLIVYNRDNAQFDEHAVARIAEIPNVVGLKDGVGDLDSVARLRSTARAHRRDVDAEFQFFNGMPTAEVYQRGYAAIGVVDYTSAAYTIAPDVAMAYYDALQRDDVPVLSALDESFMFPLVRLRLRSPGYAVSIVKAGARLSGIDAGRVRAPILDLLPEENDTLRDIIAEGRRVIA